MKILDELKAMGIELTEDQQKAITKKFTSEVISVAESDKKVKKVTEDLETVQQKLTDTEETLKGFDGVDVEGFKKQIAELEQANKQKDADYAAQIQQRDYTDAIEKLTADIKFSSAAAKKSFISDLTNEPLQMRDGKVLGFEDYLKGVKESDPESFITESDDNAATFTAPNGAQNDDKSTGGLKLDGLRSIMGLANDK